MNPYTNQNMNAWLRWVLALGIGAVLGLSIAYVITVMPWEWLQWATIIVLLGSALVWNVRQLRWVRRQQREMRAEHERFITRLRGDS